MNRIMYFGFISILLLVLTSCAYDGYVKDTEDSYIIELPNRYVVGLEAEDIVNIMLRAGFTDEQIIELGMILRNKLATAGAAQVRVGELVDAIFAVDPPYLHVASRKRGAFIYDYKRNEIK